ncbi:hypothetical protein RFI_30774 [Reticulomyxa filosa]|uniref:EF-hand domain-containing protein n=1 Tax=Reticulomyxa filosa TaxID=46433 RepID=X6LXE0_RETFI|nr:hypothetical protein RFI_30774 [Reticulomyxa filosa]|eukprot:ETO06618.1 hypothetical protein RFI_30774 [Reticulomyxa filosa]
MAKKEQNDFVSVSLFERSKNEEEKRVELSINNPDSSSVFKSAFKFATNLEYQRHQDPFKPHVRKTICWEDLKIIIFICSGILLLKIIIGIILILIMYLFACIGTCCRSIDKSYNVRPISCYRKFWSKCIQWSCRILLFFVFGIYYVPVKKILKQERPHILIVNHITMLDQLLLFAVCGAVLAVDINIYHENKFFGRILDACHCIWLKNDNKEDDNNNDNISLNITTTLNKDSVSKYTNYSKLSPNTCLPLQLYPNDIITNMYASIPFNCCLEVFHIKKPIQPVLILPQNYKKNAITYANNVRSYICYYLGSDITNYNIDDAFVWNIALYQLNMKAWKGQIRTLSMKNISIILQFDKYQVSKICQYYHKYTSEFNIHGRLDLKEFIEMMNMGRKIRDKKPNASKYINLSLIHNKLSCLHRKPTSDIVFADFLVFIGICVACEIRRKIYKCKKDEELNNISSDIKQDCILLFFLFVDMDGDGLISINDIYKFLKFVFIEEEEEEKYELADNIKIIFNYFKKK